MKEWKLKEIAELTNGQIRLGDPSLVVGQPVSDSRKAMLGSIFVPIRGEKVDGHRFLSGAAERGAVATFVRQGFPLADVPAEMAVIEVQEPELALQDWARQYLASISAKVVGVTGSIGKTTTKEMVAAVLSKKHAVLKNEGNLNTEIGLPLTVLRAMPDHEYLVLEMGMRGLGEISQLTEIARPDVAVITNVGEAHIELLGSVENIAQAKGEILEGMNSGGVAVLNGDDEMVAGQSHRAQGQVIWFGLGPKQEHQRLYATNLANQGAGISFRVHWQQDIAEVSIPWPGQHNVYNAMAALSVGIASGLSLVEAISGLSSYRPAGNRLNITRCEVGYTIVDDTYNASPASMRAALQVLRDFPDSRRRIAVLGDMLELGHAANQMHRELGRDVVDCRVDLLLTVGSLSEEIASGAIDAGLPCTQVQSFADNSALSDFLQPILRPGDLVLLKGSRGMLMEQIVERLVGKEGLGQ